VKQMVDDFHRRGVRVMFPVMLWDRGTHAEDTPDADALTRELAAVGADGINGDTLDGMPRSFARLRTRSAILWRSSQRMGQPPMRWLPTTI